ncbi:hypothetical protein CR513_40354, partial [Mucuna pruriens]
MAKISAAKIERKEETQRASRELLWMFSSVVFPLLQIMEMKVDQVLACFDYDDYEKVKMVMYKFTKYALVWWNHIRRQISNLELRSRFVPASYARVLYNKLQRMYQGSKCIEEYLKDMEVALMRANVLESNEAIMTRFLNGLNKDIQSTTTHLYEWRLNRSGA